MKTNKVTDWITAKSTKINPEQLAKVLSGTFYIVVALTALSILLLPYWVSLIGLFLILAVGIFTFTGLLMVTKAMTHPEDMLDKMLQDVDMNEVMAMATQLFGQMPVKPIGPIGVVKNEPNRK